jgi:5-methylthioadenosine/S-adenosylhomocysteine deaminase
LRGSGASVIHCPGSHRFFGHKRFPLEDLRTAGVRVALGTDGLASNEDLSMLREMRLLQEAYPGLSEEEILRMATIEGARALGLEKEIGSIEVGKKADLIAVRRPVLEAESVVFSMIGGKICLSP